MTVIEVIDILHKSSHTISYKNIRLQNSAWAKMYHNKRLMLSNMRKGVTTHSTIDNNDGNQENTEECWSYPAAGIQVSTVKNLCGQVKAGKLVASSMVNNCIVSFKLKLEEQSHQDSSCGSSIDPFIGSLCGG